MRYSTVRPCRISTPISPS